MSRPLHAPAAHPSTLVVLLMPELLARQPDPAKLGATLIRTDRLVRVLFRVADPAQLPFAEKFSQGGIATQLLLGRGVSAPVATQSFAHWPQGGTANDLDEFAFAMSDVVLVDPSKATTKRARRAKELGKTLIEPGDLLPSLPSVPSATLGLDPDADGWRWRGRRCFGRPEQLMLEILAFDLFSHQEGGRAKSWQKFWACWGLKWRPKAYFGPDSWKSLAPDPAVIDPNSELVQRFEALDRSALFGSYIHRDQIWAVHALGALAVFAAVAGVIFDPPEVFAGVEIGTLVIMALLVALVRRYNLHDRWMACRMGAEQLRIARMCLPLMVLPPALISLDAVSGSAEHGGDRSDLTSRALEQVKRVIRDHGLLLLGAPSLPDTAVNWLQRIVAGQIDYHRNNHAKLERAERRGNLIGLLIFVLVIGVAVYEMVAKTHDGASRSLCPLLVTAGGPALVAALHGSMTRLGIVHRSALSRLAERDLRPIDVELKDIAGRPVKTDETWADVRALAFRASEAMGRENTSWHGQVRLQRDALAS